MTDYDSPWKQMLAQYFPEFLAFFFPKVHAGIVFHCQHGKLATLRDKNHLEELWFLDEAP